MTLATVSVPVRDLRDGMRIRYPGYGHVKVSNPGPDVLIPGRWAFGFSAKGGIGAVSGEDPGLLVEVVVA